MYYKKSKQKITTLKSRRGVIHTWSKKNKKTLVGKNNATAVTRVFNEAKFVSFYSEQ